MFSIQVLRLGCNELVLPFCSWLALVVLRSSCTTVEQQHQLLICCNSVPLIPLTHISNDAPAPDKVASVVQRAAVMNGSTLFVVS